MARPWAARSTSSADAARRSGARAARSSPWTSGRGGCGAPASLPVALSDLGAVGFRGHVVVAGGRDAAGAVHDEVLDLAPR